MFLKNLIPALLVVSCAQIHKGNFATQVTDDSKKVEVQKEKFNIYSNNRTGSSRSGKKTKSGLLISYEWSRVYKDKHFNTLDFTFENTSSKWKKIEKIGVHFDNTNIKSIYFLKGAPLESFLKAKNLEIRIDAKNRAMVAGLAAGIAAGSSSFSNNNYNNFSSGLVALGSANIAEQNQLRKINQYPEEHLFGSKDKFLIPPSLAITKFLVFFTEEPELFKKLNYLYITYHLKDGQKETIKLDISTR